MTTNTTYAAKRLLLMAILSVMIGQFSGMLDEIKPVAVIMEELVSGLAAARDRVVAFSK